MNFNSNCADSSSAAIFGASARDNEALLGTDPWSTLATTLEADIKQLETRPGIKESLKKEYGFDVKFDRAKDLLEENDGAGNTFKATAKPVLIGTAVVGATTMIFSIIVQGLSVKWVIKRTSAP